MEEFRNTKDSAREPDTMIDLELRYDSTKETVLCLL